MGSVKCKDESEKSTDDDRRRLELSLELGPEGYRGADGEVNDSCAGKRSTTPQRPLSASSRSRSLESAKTAHEYRTNESDNSEHDTATYPICEGTAQEMRRESRYICDGVRAIPRF
jgi:hypothetical protein